MGRPKSKQECEVTEKEIKTKQLVTEREGVWESHIEHWVARSHGAVDAMTWMAVADGIKCNYNNKNNNCKSKQTHTTFKSLMYTSMNSVKPALFPKFVKPQRAYELPWGYPSLGLVPAERKAVS